MTETALLSPNGQQETEGKGPATRLFVATIEGVLRFDRAGARCGVGGDGPRPCR